MDKLFERYLSLKDSLSFAGCPLQIVHKGETYWISIVKKPGVITNIPAGGTFEEAVNNLGYFITGFWALVEAKDLFEKERRGDAKRWKEKLTAIN